MFELDNKVAIVTGSSRGLGRGIAISLAKAGANLIINYRNSKEKALQVQEECRALGAETLVVQADVSEKEDVDKLFDSTMSKFGKVDILVNNAGTDSTESIFDLDIEKWEEIMKINLTSNFLCAKKAMEIMRKQQYGRIIQVSSVVAEQGSLYDQVHYAASKAGQLGITKTLARTGAPHGITVNAITPGVIKTDLVLESLGIEGRLDAVLKKIPMGKLGELEDMGTTAVFLASDEAKYITGVTIQLNGGLYIC